LYGKKVDVVVWPEGASDVDPLEDPNAAELWNQVAQRANAPLVGGTITTRTTVENGKEVTRYYNTSLLWKAGTGVVDYVWRNPVTNAVERKRSFIQRVDNSLLGVGYYLD
jgi:apolipoprotein N-acyltransferase